MSLPTLFDVAGIITPSALNGRYFRTDENAFTQAGGVGKIRPAGTSDELTHCPVCDYALEDGVCYDCGEWPPYEEGEDYDYCPNCWEFIEGIFPCWNCGWEPEGEAPPIEGDIPPNAVWEWIDATHRRFFADTPLGSFPAASDWYPADTEVLGPTFAIHTKIQVEIEDKDDLNMIAEVYGKLTLDFVQVADIDYGGDTMTPPIGMGQFYKGTFDGGGFTIANVTIPGMMFGGLEGTAQQDAVLCDIHLRNITVIGAYAPLVNQVRSNTLVERCDATGSATGWSNVGGLIGQTVTGHSDIVMRYCWSAVHVTTTSSSTSTRAGGFIREASGTAHIHDCYASGNVTCNRGLPCGFVGRIVFETITFERCYAVGTITSPDTPRGFGHYTHTSGQPDVSGCYHNGPSANDNSGAVLKTDAQLKQKATFVDWDFQTVWDIEEATGYPFLNLRDVKAAASRVFGQFATALMTGGIARAGLFRKR